VYGGEDTRPVPSARVICAWVVVFADNTVAEMLRAAQALSTDARNTLKCAGASLEHRIMLTGWTTGASAKEVEIVDTVIAGADVAVVAIHA